MYFNIISIIILLNLTNFNNSDSFKRTAIEHKQKQIEFSNGKHISQMCDYYFCTESVSNGVIL